MKKLLAIILCICILFSFAACNSENEPPIDNEGGNEQTPETPEAPDNGEQTPDGGEQTPDGGEQTPDGGEQTPDGGEQTPDDGEQTPDPAPTYELKLEALEEIMQPIFLGDTVKNETVMFLDYGDEKTLLYPIDTVISVTSYDGSKTYVEGKDYSIVDGKIKILDGSSIPCITRNVYYNASDSTLVTIYNGKNANTHWGEGKPMTNWQVNVSYTHKDGKLSFEQVCESEYYKGFIDKLIAGEDVTVFFFGDSITRGANSSWEKNYAPYQYPYSIVFTQALADLFDYKVHYIASDVGPEGKPTSKVPSSDYVAGDRGTITYINTSIGGWTSETALENFDVHVKAFVEQYGCDLFVCAFGINDGSPARNTNTALARLVKKLYEIVPETNVMIVSTMVPNPNGLSWYKYQYQQEALLLKTAETLRKEGKACAVVCVTSMSQAILERKEFNDYSGNNINHPNDFFIRVYAQTMLQALLGYENLK